MRLLLSWPEVNQRVNPCQAIIPKTFLKSVAAQMA
jgi:hypothetical protein